MTTQNPTRRTFLKTSAQLAVATASVATIPNALAEVLTATPRTVKSLKLFNTHTYETLDVTFYSNGVYHLNALNKLNFLLRDHRENEAMIMDRGLFDQMWALQQRCGGEEVFEVISAYRSPATNNRLRETTSGVAEKSYHLSGQAIDIRLRGTKLSKLRQEAVAMNAGGVGYYPGSDFIHLDTGKARNWS